MNVINRKAELTHNHRFYFIIHLKWTTAANHDYQVLMQKQIKKKWAWGGSNFF